MIIALMAFLFILGLTIGFVMSAIVGKYPDGQLIVKEDENGAKQFILDLDIDPYFIDQKKIIKFVVVQGEPEKKPKPPMPLPPKYKRPSQDKHGL